MKFIEHDIFANGIKLHIYRTATDNPPIIFVHGRSDNGFCFSPVAEQFSADFNIILYDSRNHGKSGATEKSNLIDRANDLAGLIDALELEKPILIGHSLGAVTIALFAGLNPNVPKCVILEDPPPFEVMAAKDEQAVAFDKAWREIAAANKQKTIEELIEINRQESPSWPEVERYPWAQAKQQFNLNAFDEETIDIEEGHQIVSRITCPVLLITGSLEKNSMYPPQAADRLVAELPDAQHVNIPGAGHNIRRDQPAKYLEAVQEFLNNH